MLRAGGEGRAAMHQTEEAIDRARAVFAGLAPSAPTAAPARTRDTAAHSAFAKGMMATVPIVLAGTLTVTGAIAPVHAAPASERKPAKPKSTLGSTVRAAVVAAAATTKTQAAAPTTYTVKAGDTVSSIAGRYGLAT